MTSERMERERLRKLAVRHGLRLVTSKRGFGFVLEPMRPSKTAMPRQCQDLASVKQELATLDCA